MPSLLSQNNQDRCCRSAAGRCDPRPPGPLLEHPLPLQVLAARRLLEHPLLLQAMSHKSSSGGEGGSCGHGRCHLPLRHGVRDQQLKVCLDC